MVLSFSGEEKGLRNADSGCMDMVVLANLTLDVGIFGFEFGVLYYTTQAIARTERKNHRQDKGRRFTIVTLSMLSTISL